MPYVNTITKPNVHKMKLKGNHALLLSSCLQIASLEMLNSEEEEEKKKKTGTILRPKFQPPIKPKQVSLISLNNGIYEV